MRFQVGPWPYRVKITTGLKNDEGKEVAGLCVWRDHTIHLSADMPVRRRLETLLHELRHCWQHTMGRTDDDESDANQVAAFTADVMRQLERQGGDMALMRLNAEGVVDSGADVEVAGEPRAAQCPACSGMLNMPIKTEGSEFDPARNRNVARRSADCDFCGHTVFWFESVTSSGVPTGQIVRGPEVTSGRAHAVPSA